MEGLKHGEKLVDGVVLKYLCQPCPECAMKLELFARYKKALEDLTPGGSEYVNNPERCATVIRDRFAGPIALLKRQRARLEMAEEMANLLVEIQDNLNQYHPMIKKVQQTISAREKAGRGER